MKKPPDKWVRNASDRQAIAEGCYWSQDDADHICDFFETFLSVTTGRLAGEPFKLFPWEREYLSRLNGWRQADGTRRFRRVFSAVAKKNGKSFLSSGLAVYFGIADGESQPEIIMAASSRDQAEIMYRETKNMINASPSIKKLCKVVDSRKRVELPSGSGYIKVISSDANRSEGINASLVLCDEIHAWPGEQGSSLYDALLYAGTAREQPLIIVTTTAGHDKDSFCYREWEYAQKVINGEVIDTTLLPIIYAADGMDYDDPQAWQSANPSLGTVLSERDFKAELSAAKESPVKWNTFLRYRLNIWVDADCAWLDSFKWAACAGKLDPAELEGCHCFGGLDLASVSDLCSFSLFFPETCAVLSWSWIPKNSAYKRSEKNHAPYLDFIKAGKLKATPGDVADYEIVREDINALGQRYQIETIGVDPWNSAHLSNLLTQDGFDMAPFRQGYGSMSGPCKEFEKLVLEEKLIHFADPLLAWASRNVVVEIDPAGNIKPSKRKSSEKIDPIVATVMAVGLAMVSAPVGPSVYESRGLLTF